MAPQYTTFQTVCETPLTLGIYACSEGDKKQWQFTNEMAGECQGKFCIISIECENEWHPLALSCIDFKLDIRATSSWFEISAKQHSKDRQK